MYYYITGSYDVNRDSQSKTYSGTQFAGIYSSFSGDSAPSSSFDIIISFSSSSSNG